MDLSSIRKTIAEAVEHEQRTGALARIVRSAYSKSNPYADEAELDRRTQTAVESITAYVTAMADVVQATMEAGEKAGVAEAMGPIFETALAYVDEQIDFIPDRLGLSGLIDDAYLVHGLMQEISHRHRALTGRGLLPESYFADSQRIRRMIGEPTATRLDVAVVAFARRHNVRQTIEQIFERIGSTGMGIQLPVAVAFPDSGDGIDELPDLELGTLGE